MAYKNTGNVHVPLANNTYTQSERQEAVRLAEKYGTHAAARQLQLGADTIKRWRRNMTEDPPPPTEDPLPLEYRQMITKAVQEGLKQYSPLQAPDEEVLAREAIKALRRRLKAFPDVCLRAQEAEGAEAIVLEYEIWDIKRALEGISADQYYQIVPLLYFHKRTNREICL